MGRANKQQGPRAKAASQKKMAQWAFVGMCIVTGAFLFLWGGGTREPFAIVFSPQGDHVIVLVRSSSDSSRGRSSTQYAEFKAYSLDDGSLVGEMSEGTYGKPLGNVGDKVWIGPNHAELVDVRAGKWLIESSDVKSKYPMLGDALKPCLPDSDDFNGPMNVETGALCVTGTNGLTYYLGMDGQLQNGEDVTLAPSTPSPCANPKREWWLEGTDDECIGTAPDPRGGFALVSTKGWRSEPLIKPELLRNKRGFAARFGEDELIVVRHEGARFSGIDSEGKMRWTVSARAAGHRKIDNPTAQVSDTRLVVASQQEGKALVTVFRLADGAVERTLDL